MATTKITNPELFDLASLDTALKLPSGTTAERPTSPSTGEWRYNTDNNLIEYYDGGGWRELQDEEIPPIPSENFNTVLYNGTSATHAITGLGFEPDLVWIKDRGNAEQHIWNDSTRGAGNDLSSNTTAAEANRPTGFLSFDSDGFTLGTDGGGVVNDSTRGPYVAWCWKGGGNVNTYNINGTGYSTASAAGLDGGNINPTGASINTKAGFGIYKASPTIATQSISHGLSQAPDMYIFKTTNISRDWYVSFNDSGTWKFGGLNTTAAFSTTTAYTANSSTMVIGGGSSVNEVVYAFHSVSGYSKIGTYTGNGSTNGPIVETGFEPAFLLIKRTDTAGYNWNIWDNKRTPAGQKVLYANLNNAEGNYGYINFLSNGFQHTRTNAGVNANGGTYLYIAFAADPSTAPVLADSFANKLYNGTGNTQSITGLGFKPSLVWLKTRNDVIDWYQNDMLSGAGNFLRSNTTNAIQASGTLYSFEDDGFGLRGGGYDLNQAGQNNISYSWKANSIPASNTDGTTQSIVSANQESGFSIIKYTGTGLNATVGHGLSSAPELVITKKTSGVQNWMVGTDGIGWTKYLELNLSNAAATASTTWNNTAPTETTVSLGSSANGNDGGSQYIMYAFHSISGFSKIGSYTGTGSSGNAQNIGFQPDFVMIKSTGSYNWNIYDSKRPSGSITGRYMLIANAADTEYTTSVVHIDITSTGFSFPNAYDGTNKSGQDYIYMAFKENPTP